MKKDRLRKVSLKRSRWEHGGGVYKVMVEDTEVGILSRSPVYDGSGRFQWVYDPHTGEWRSFKSFKEAKRFLWIT